MVATVNSGIVQIEKPPKSERSLPSLGTNSTDPLQSQCMSGRSDVGMSSSSSLNESSRSIGQRKINELGNRKLRSSSQQHSKAKNELSNQASASSSNYPIVEKGSMSSLDFHETVATGQTTQEASASDSQRSWEVALKGNRENEVGISPPSSPGRSLRGRRRSSRLRSSDMSDNCRHRSRSQGGTIDPPHHSGGNRKHLSIHHDHSYARDKDSSPNRALASYRNRARSRESNRDKNRDGSRDRTRDRSRDRTRDRSRDRTRDHSRGNRTTFSTRDNTRDRDPGNSSHTRSRRSRGSAGAEQDDYSGSPHSTSRRRKRTVSTRRGSSNNKNEGNSNTARRTKSSASTAESITKIEGDLHALGESNLLGSNTTMYRSQSLSQEETKLDPLHDSLGSLSIKSKESHISYKNSGKLDAMLEQNSNDAVSSTRNESSNQSTGQQSNEQEDGRKYKSDLDNMPAPQGLSVDESVGPSGFNSVSLRSYYTPQVRVSRRKTTASTRNNPSSQQVGPGTLVIPTSYEKGNDRRVRVRRVTARTGKTASASRRNSDAGQPTPGFSDSPNDVNTSPQDADEKNGYSSTEEAEIFSEDVQNVEAAIVPPPFTSISQPPVRKEPIAEPAEKLANGQKNWKSIAKKVMKKSRSILKVDETNFDSMFKGKRKLVTDAHSFGQLPSDDDCDDFLGIGTVEESPPDESCQAQHDISRFSPGDTKRRNRILGAAKNHVRKLLHKSRNHQVNGISSAEQMKESLGALQDSETFDRLHDGETFFKGDMDQEIQGDQETDTEEDEESPESDGQVQPAQFDPESLLLMLQPMEEETNTKSPGSKSRSHRSFSPTRALDSRRLKEKLSGTTQCGVIQEDSHLDYRKRSSSQDRFRREPEKTGTRSRSKSRSRKSRTMKKRSERKQADEGSSLDAPERTRRTSRTDARSVSPGSLVDSGNTRVQRRRSHSSSPGNYRNSLSKRREAMKKLRDEKAKMSLDDEEVEVSKIEQSGSGNSNSCSSGGVFSRRCRRITRIDSAGRIKSFESANIQLDGNSEEDESLNALSNKLKLKKRRDDDPEKMIFDEGTTHQIMNGGGTASHAELPSGPIER